MHPWKVHAWEVFNWWTVAFVDQLVEPKNQKLFRIDFFFNKKILVLLSASFERFGVSGMRDLKKKNVDVRPRLLVLIALGATPMDLSYFDGFLIKLRK